MSVGEVKRKQLANAYANNTGGCVAFVDESYLAPAFDVRTPVEAFYLMTAYVIPVGDLDGMRPTCRAWWGRDSGIPPMRIAAKLGGNGSANSHDM